MSELKKCPFCGNIPRMKSGLNSEGEQFYQVTHDCMNLLSQIKTFCYKTEPEAIAAWNRRALPENEPLTLEELRQMDGEPVWVTCKDGSGARWGIVKNTEFGLCAVVDDDTAYWFTPECGTIAYRRKPERSEG